MRNRPAAVHDDHDRSSGDGAADESVMLDAVDESMHDGEADASGLHAPPEDTITMLIATDNHLGYMEKDPIRGDDSIRAFEEILKIAHKKNACNLRFFCDRRRGLKCWLLTKDPNQVDMILLGGDLFHDNKPSRKTLHSTMELLRAYCLGDRPCALDILSDQSINFPNRFATVNYQDPNLNVAMPIFSIHGNHDDPSGDGNLAALDLLSVTGLVNYFGRQREADAITMTPILLRKGATKLALYGLGNVRDERLHRTFLHKKVKMLRPLEATDEWFNLLTIHQNRVPHGKTNYIPETFLDPFVHLVLWGHEHECCIDPVFNSQQEFYVTQPGSSIATSLSEGEAVEKHVAVLRIHQTSFELEKIRLTSVRPFVIRDLVLGAIDGLREGDMKAATKLIVATIEDMVRSAVDEWIAEHPDLGPADAPVPLVRLKVEYTGFSTFNPQRFGQQFVGKVANPKDVVLFYRKRRAHVPKDAKAAAAPRAATAEELRVTLPDKLDQVRMEDLVNDLLDRQKLEVLPERELGDAVRMFVEKHDNEAIKEFVNGSLDQVRGTLVDAKPPSEDVMRQTIAAAKQMRNEAYSADATLERMLATRRGGAGGEGGADGDDTLMSDGEPPGPAPAPRGRAKAATTKTTTATRGRGRGRAAAKTASAATTRKTTAASRKRRVEESDESDEDEPMDVDGGDNDDDDDDLVEVAPAKKRAAPARTTATRATRASTAAAAAASQRLTQTTLQFAAPPAAGSAAAASQSGTQRSLPSSFAGVTSRGRGRGRGRK
ncbi:DNA repair protein (mre11) [Allomyces macrogynus ATCC 38327]|uniref:Double-strand break repair protein n=1 Tax=Allomyces macrogynus (strain ATCC 38327) TaxID=578462 RepID=A0A0L0S497_ALLM3|nr:DNA repair protein (mre11) [Allomyces macrogynus ATCC 38327]|eukprot:KNE57270.1 DNA repair protein (mre11) [Allomyces macrogynus ATCC 38327]